MAPAREPVTPAAPALALHRVSVRFATVPAVDEVDLAVAEGERLGVLGPSGSGKSTLLRAICGLEPLAAGRIEWHGRDLAGTPTHRRRFGLMFQDYVLFPHLDVAGNVGFGLDALGVSGAERAGTVAEALDLVGLRGFERRLPAQLSGGEQQRVALARAIAPRPRLLMLDEPLGALDRALRRTLLDDLLAVFERLDVPIIYVTHDHEEALAVGRRVAVMRSGRLETVLPPAELWRRPPSEFVARFLGFTNLLPASVRAGRVETALGALDAATLAPVGGDSARLLLVRPDAFRPAADGPIRAEVAEVTFRGDHTLLRVTLDASPERDAPTLLDVEWRRSPIPAVGEHLRLSLDPDGLVLLP